jgi:hypothetical protein
MPTMPMPDVAFLSSLHGYFSAEKRESWLFTIFGVAALVAAAALFRGHGPYRGMLYPLALVGLIQVGVGSAVLVRTDRQVQALVAQHARDPATMAQAERTRMTTVMGNFQIYKVIEIVVLVAGVALVYAFAYGRAAHAAGIGCIAQGSLMLVLDLFAEGRGHAYLAALAPLVPR